MAEYIERETLLQDISETVVFTVSAKQKLPTTEMRGANKVIDRIKYAPTADVVEVVRCKDCVYFRESDKTNRTFCTYHGDDYEFETHRNKFCSDGVKAKLKE